MCEPSGRRGWGRQKFVSVSCQKLLKLAIKISHCMLINEKKNAEY
jgi:hypothetical protein